MGKKRKANVRTCGLTAPVQVERRTSGVGPGGRGCSQASLSASRHHFLSQCFRKTLRLVSLMTKYQPSRGLKPSTSAGITGPNKAALCVVVLHLHTAGLVGQITRIINNKTQAGALTFILRASTPCFLIQNVENATRNLYLLGYGVIIFQATTCTVGYRYQLQFLLVPPPQKKKQTR